jgi:hypothetical protein
VWQESNVGMVVGDTPVVDALAVGERRVEFGVEPVAGEGKPFGDGVVGSDGDENRWFTPTKLGGNVGGGRRSITAGQS